MRRIIFVFCILLLTGCETESLQTSIDELGDSPQEIIGSLGSQITLKKNYSVSISDDKITFISEEESIYISLLEEDFYVAIAPYQNNTHP